MDFQLRSEITSRWLRLEIIKGEPFIKITGGCKSNSAAETCRQPDGALGSKNSYTERLWMSASASLTNPGPMWLSAVACTSAFLAAQGFSRNVPRTKIVSSALIQNSCADTTSPLGNPCRAAT